MFLSIILYYARTINFFYNKSSIIKKLSFKKVSKNKGKMVLALNFINNNKRFSTIGMNKIAKHCHGHKYHP